MKTVSDLPPWNAEDYPPHLRGMGYRIADQDGGDGEEWVDPVQDMAETMVEAARVLLDATPRPD